MKKQFFLFLCVSILLISSAPAENVIVRDGKSDVVITHKINAPKSVSTAARELQHYIHKATGVKLEIQTDVNTETRSINLGFGPAKTKAGLSMEGIGPEGYRITCQKGNLYIYGQDTKDGTFTENGGFSRGTLFGVYAFLEKFLGIRWIMPGEIGEIVPLNPALVIPDDVEILENPGFLKRQLPYTGKGKKVREWLTRQRLGTSLGIYRGHIWHHVFGKPKIAENHPEWFAEIGGARVKPEGLFKICTSNPEVVNHMANCFKNVFRSNPLRKGYSASATDGWGFCQCERCRSLDEKPFPKKLGRQYTRRMLIFYNQIAEKLATEFPDKWVCGMVYQSHEFPPEPFDVPVHKNVYLCWAAAMDYGIRHYAPEVKKLWHKTLKEWAQAAKGRLGYYDLPNQLTGSVKVPSPPCREIMNDIMPTLKKEKIISVIIYGTKNWESGGIINYVNAKMIWNPNLEADDPAREYCNLAYGAAGKTMKSLYDFLETQYKKFMCTNPNQSYNMSPEAMRQIYADNFTTLENFYKDAAARPLTIPQRQRLDLFCFDMVRLHRYLKAFGWLKNAEASIFNVSDKQFNALCRERGIKVDNIKLDKIDYKVVRNSFIPSSAPSTNFKKVAGNNFWCRKNHIFAVKAESDGEIVIPVTTKKYRTPLVSYIVYTNSGEIIKSGTIPRKGEIRFFGREGVVYYIRANAGSTGYNLNLANLTHAVYSRKLIPKHEDGFHLFGGECPVPIYFAVPKKTEKFTIGLKSNAPGETASAILYNPDGKKVAELKTLTKQNDSITISPAEHAGKIWKLEMIDPESGVYDDAWLTFEDGLSGWFSFDPKHMLVFKK